MTGAIQIGSGRLEAVWGARVTSLAATMLNSNKEHEGFEYQSSGSSCLAWLALLFTTICPPGDQTSACIAVAPLGETYNQSTCVHSAP